MNRVVALVLWGLLPVTAFAQLPNHQLTPGQVRTTSRTEICSHSFHTASVRKTTYAMKKQICREYGVKRCPWKGVIEIDHLVSIETGGADVRDDLWVQFAKYADGSPGFHEKDRLENFLHRQVCAGKMSLSDAQSCQIKNWINCWKKLGRP